MTLGAGDSFRARLALLRKAKNLTQQELEKRIGKLETEGGYISRIETGGIETPPFEVMDQIAHELDVEAVELFFSEGLDENADRSSGITQKRAMRVTSKPANDKTRDIDTGERAYSLRQHEQCLERRKETTSHRTGEARMALAADRASHWCPSGTSTPLPEGGRDRGA